MAAFNLTNEVRSVLCQLILFGSGGAHWVPCRTPGSRRRVAPEILDFGPSVRTVVACS